MYTGPSIVDYLNSVGKPSDYATRANLAIQNGITNYTGTAQQNTQLLSLLRGSGGGTPSTNTNTGTTWTPVGPNGKSVTYDPTGGTDYPTSPEQIAAAKQNTNVGEFPTYSTYGGYIYMPTDRDILNNLINSTQPTKQINLPQTGPGTPGVGGIDGMLAYYKSLFETQQKQADDYQKQIDEQRKQQKEQTGGFLSNLIKSKNPNQVRLDAQNETGIQPAQYFAEQKAQISEIGQLNTQYNNLVAQRDQQIANAQGRTASMSFINNQVAQINRNAAPELNRISADLNAKAAILQATQGMWAEAQKYVNQAVDAATADLKYNFDMYNEFYDQNQTVIDSLDKKYQTALQGARDTAEKAFTFAQDQKTKVGQLMIDNPQANISINDTLEMAIAKVQKSPKTTGSTVGSAETGYQNVVRDAMGNVVKTTPITGGSGNNQPAGGIKLTSSQINNGAVNAGLDVESFKKLDSNVQNYFANTSDKVIQAQNDEVTKVKSGEKTAEEVNNLIDSSNLAPAVKAYWKQRVASSTPAASEKKASWYSRTWDWITSQFK